MAENSDLNSLNKLVMKKLGFNALGLKNYSSVIKKDISAMITITPDHHYPVKCNVTLRAGTKVTIFGNNIPAIQTKDHYSFERLGNTNNLFFQIETMDMGNDGHFHCPLEKLVQVLQPK